MSDQTPDPTALDDDQLDSLLDALAERAAERDDLDLPGTGASRRTVLTGLLGLGGAAAGASVASAVGENYSSASGVVGTDSEPLDEANIKDLHAQGIQATNGLVAGELLASDSGQTTTLSVSVSRDNFSQLIINLPSLEIAPSGEAQLVVDGDDNAGTYEEIFNDGSVNSSENVLTFYSVGGDGGIAGGIITLTWDNGALGRFNLGASLGSRSVTTDIQQLLVGGGVRRDVTSSIEIRGLDDSTGRNSIMEVYGVR